MSLKALVIAEQAAEALRKSWPEDAIRIAFNAGFRIGLGFRKWPRGLKAEDIVKARRRLVQAWKEAQRFVSRK